VMQQIFEVHLHKLTHQSSASQLPALHKSYSSCFSISSMSDGIPKRLADFWKAKAEFEEKARNVTATDGIVDNGDILEQDLVGPFSKYVSDFL
jgi:hypothetical protein